MFKRLISTVVLVTFFVSLMTPSEFGWAAESGIRLPEPGVMVNLSSAYEPVMMKGLKLDPKNPFRFEFIIDPGDDGRGFDLPAGRQVHQTQDKGIINHALTDIKSESTKLIKYFLASLTIPEKDLWVNLSPYEKDRMIASNLAQTEMGRDMLAQDYILKQLTASLIYPEKDLGKAFWDKVYVKAQAMYGNTNIPVNTFNKVWIVADKADVFERGNVAYVVGAHLKVMLESDYVATQKNSVGDEFPVSHKGAETSSIQTNQIVREIVLPALEQEINTGKNFAPLRQMFYSMILASWYKMALKDAVLTQVYGNQSKVKIGVNQKDIKTNDEIFNQYLKAYKKGVFNYIKEDIDQTSKKAIPRKYFSGGLEIFSGGNAAQIVHRLKNIPQNTKFSTDDFIAKVDLTLKDSAMRTSYKSDSHYVTDLINRIADWILVDFESHKTLPSINKIYRELRLSAWDLFLLRYPDILQELESRLQFQSVDPTIAADLQEQIRIKREYLSKIKRNPRRMEVKVEQKPPINRPIIPKKIAQPRGIRYVGFDLESVVNGVEEMFRISDERESLPTSEQLAEKLGGGRSTYTDNRDKIIQALEDRIDSNLYESEPEMEYRLRRAVNQAITGQWGSSDEYSKFANAAMLTPLAQRISKRLVQGLMKTLPPESSADLTGLAMSEESYLYLNRSLIYLLREEYDDGMGEEGDSQRPSLDDLAYIGDQLNEAWKRRTGQSIFPYISPFIDKLELDREDSDLSTTFYRKYSELEALTSRGTIEDRSLGLWMRGIQIALHLRKYGIHAEEAKPQKLELADNELLIKIVHQLMGLMIQWKKEKSWNLPVPVEKGYKGQSLPVSYGNLMMWGLIKMLDPVIHNYRYRRDNLVDGLSELTDDFIADKKWQRPEDSIDEYMSRMLDIPGVGQGEVLALLQEAFVNLKEGHFFDLQSPLRAATGNYEISVRSLIKNSNPLRVPKVFAVVLRKDEVLSAVTTQGKGQRASIEQGLYRSTPTSEANKGIAYQNVNSLTERELLEQYAAMFERILGGRFKSVAGVIRQMMPPTGTGNSAMINAQEAQKNYDVNKAIIDQTKAVLKPRAFIDWYVSKKMQLKSAIRPGDHLTVLEALSVCIIAQKIQSEQLPVYEKHILSFEYAKQSEVIQIAPFFQTYQEIISWYEQQRKRLPAINPQDPFLRMSQLPLVLSYADKLPSKELAKVEPPVALYEHIKGSSILTDAPTFASPEEFMQWHFNHREILEPSPTEQETFTIRTILRIMIDLNKIPESDFNKYATHATAYRRALNDRGVIEQEIRRIWSVRGFQEPADLVRLKNELNVQLFRSTENPEKPLDKTSIFLIAEYAYKFYGKDIIEEIKRNPSNNSQRAESWDNEFPPNWIDNPKQDLLVVFDNPRNENRSLSMRIHVTSLGYIQIKTFVNHEQSGWININVNDRDMIIEDFQVFNLLDFQKSMGGKDNEQMLMAFIEKLAQAKTRTIETRNALIGQHAPSQTLHFKTLLISDQAVIATNKGQDAAMSDQAALEASFAKIKSNLDALIADFGDESFLSKADGEDDLYPFHFRLQVSHSLINIKDYFSVTTLRVEDLENFQGVQNYFDLLSKLLLELSSVRDLNAYRISDQLQKEIIKKDRLLQVGTVIGSIQTSIKDQQFVDQHQVEIQLLGLRIADMRDDLEELIEQMNPKTIVGTSVERNRRRTGISHRRLAITISQLTHRLEGLRLAAISPSPIDAAMAQAVSNKPADRYKLRVAKLKDIYVYFIQQLSRSFNQLIKTDSEFNQLNEIAAISGDVEGFSSRLAENFLRASKLMEGKGYYETFKSRGWLTENSNVEEKVGQLQISDGEARVLLRIFKQAFLALDVEIPRQHPRITQIIQANSPLSRLVLFQEAYADFKNLIQPQPNQSQELVESLIGAAYSVRESSILFDRAKSIGEVFNREIPSLVESSIKVKQQYLKALYVPAMRGDEGAQAVDSIIKTFQENGINFTDLNEELQKQYLTAVYAAAMGGNEGAQAVGNIIKTFQDNGIEFSKLSEKLKKQYLIAIYSPAKRGESGARAVKDILTFLKVKGIAFNNLKDEETEIQYLICVYNSSMGGDAGTKALEEIVEELLKNKESPIILTDWFPIIWRLANINDAAGIKEILKDYNVQIKISTFAEWLRQQKKSLDKKVFAHVRSIHSEAMTSGSGESDGESQLKGDRLDVYNAIQALTLGNSFKIVTLDEVDDIAREKGLTRIQVIEIIEIIFGMKKMEEEGGWSGFDPNEVDDLVSGKEDLDDLAMLVDSKGKISNQDLPKGGIDFDRSKMQMNVKKEGQGVKMDFPAKGLSAFGGDPAMVERIKREGFDGLEFTIQSLEPVTNLPQYLGITLN